MENIVVFVKTENSYINIPNLSGAILDHDTLILQTPMVFYPHITHKITNRSIESTFSESLDKDTASNVTQEQAKTKRTVSLVHISEFKLNTLNFKPKEIIYGEVEFTTDPYDLDDPHFISKKIRKRLHCRYVFKVRVVSDKKLLSIMDKH
jgi:hypothetical protein